MSAPAPATPGNAPTRTTSGPATITASWRGLKCPTTATRRTATRKDRAKAALRESQRAPDIPELQPHPDHRPTPTRTTPRGRPAGRRRHTALRLLHAALLQAQPRTRHNDRAGARTRNPTPWNSEHTTAEDGAETSPTGLPGPRPQGDPRPLGQPPSHTALPFPSRPALSPPLPSHPLQFLMKNLSWPHIVQAPGPSVPPRCRLLPLSRSPRPDHSNAPAPVGSSLAYAAWPSLHWNPQNTQ